MEQKEKSLTNTSKRYQLSTNKKNQIFVEVINQNELETFWKTMTDIQFIF
jgi:CRISPR/Cas system endoribonuclease Cas6 (RAMP superfamily)